MMLLRRSKGWFTGYNSNVDGHGEGTLRHRVYNGGTPKYRSRLDAAAADYAGLTFT